MGTTSTAHRAQRRTPAQSSGLPPDADLTVLVAAAALAEYPGTTIDRVERDGEGLYSAHLVTSVGQQVVVPVDRDLTLLGWVALAR